MERTFVMFKPDTLQRELVGEVIGRLERKGLNLVAAKMLTLDDKTLDVHYAQYKDKPFFPKIKQMMKSGPVLATVWEGLDSVKIVRAMLGVTNGRDAAPGTIRGDFSMSLGFNLVHASDSVETANAEISRFFKVSELVKLKKANEAFVYSPEELEKLK